MYKPLKYYTGIKCTKSDWDELQKLPVRKAQQTELLHIEKTHEQCIPCADGERRSDALKFKECTDHKIKGKEQETINRIRIVDFIQTEILEDLSIKKGTREGYSIVRYNRL